MRFDWPYFTLSPEGELIDEIGYAMRDPDAPEARLLFSDVADAEEYLVAHDIRGSVR